MTCTKCGSGMYLEAVYGVNGTAEFSLYRCVLNAHSVRVGANAPEPPTNYDMLGVILKRGDHETTEDTCDVVSCRRPHLPTSTRCAQHLEWSRKANANSVAKRRAARMVAAAR